jgi:hypothetical protein
MANFELSGYYNFYRAPDGRGNLEGELEVEENCSFEGRIYDYASANPCQTIKGTFLLEDNRLTKLWFLKINNGSDSSQVVYELVKKFDNSLDGKYVGRWAVLPYKVEFNKDSNLFITQIDMRLSNIGDSAQINIFNGY